MPITTVCNKYGGGGRVPPAFLFTVRFVGPLSRSFVVGRSADWGGTNLPEPARGDDLADLLVFSCVCSFLEILTRVMCAIRLFARAQG